MKTPKLTYVTPLMELVSMTSEPVLIGHSKDLHDNGDGTTGGGDGSGDGEEYGGIFNVKSTNLWDDEW